MRKIRLIAAYITWNREQAATSRLLSNNFQDKKWKTAALKNAYALLGKHRHGLNFTPST
jgi:hypothetical protein